jgi:hypothetical protein
MNAEDAFSLGRTGSFRGSFLHKQIGYDKQTKRHKPVPKKTLVFYAQL